MTCADSANISFEFRHPTRGTYLEIRPREMQFDRTRGEFDYCTAEFDDSVAEHIQPYVEDEHSFLRQPLPVHLKIDGEAVYRLLWVPDGARFTDGEVHIDFHDAQKYLTRGHIDWRQKNVKLVDAYEHVFKNRDTTGPEILTDIKFTVPDEAYDELIGNDVGRLDTEFSLDSIIDDAIGGSSWMDAKLYEMAEEENVKNVLDAHYAVDFDKVTPWEAISELNEKFGVRTWVDREGVLWVGSRSITGKKHITAPDDHRVWKLSEYNITPPRDPVIRSVVQGGWADEPDESRVTNLFEIETLNMGTDEFRMEGVADRPGMFFGQTIVNKANVKKDALESVAKRKMIEKSREQWSGHLDILPELSGDSVSKVHHVTIGDSILTVPPDGDRNPGEACQTNIEKQIFDIVGIQHELGGDGRWNIRLDVVPVFTGDLAPGNIDTSLRYYDPNDKETVEEDAYQAREEDDESFWPDFGDWI